MILSDRVKQEIDILDLANHFGISINKDRKGLCPFHEDRNASLVLYPQTKSFYCYGCGVGGSVIDLTMKMKNITFTKNKTFYSYSKNN